MLIVKGKTCGGPINHFARAELPQKRGKHDWTTWLIVGLIALLVVLVLFFVPCMNQLIAMGLSKAWAIGTLLILMGAVAVLLGVFIGLNPDWFSDMVNEIANAIDRASETVGKVMTEMGRSAGSVIGDLLLALLPIGLLAGGGFLIYKLLVPANREEQDRQGLVTLVNLGRSENG